MMIREREMKLKRKNDIIQEQSNSFHRLYLQSIEMSQMLSFETYMICLNLNREHGQLVDQFINNEISEDNFINTSNNIINQLNNILQGDEDINYEYDDNDDYYSDEY